MCGGNLLLHGLDTAHANENHRLVLFAALYPLLIWIWMICLMPLNKFLLAPRTGLGVHGLLKAVRRISDGNALIVHL